MIRSSLIATKRTPLATRGMVVAEHPLGAEVGASILQKGGNALEKMGHPVVPKRADTGTLYFSRPVAIRVTKRGLEAGLEPLHDAAAAGH